MNVLSLREDVVSHGFILKGFEKGSANVIAHVNLGIIEVHLIERTHALTVLCMQHVQVEGFSEEQIQSNSQYDRVEGACDFGRQKD